MENRDYLKSQKEAFNDFIKMENTFSYCSLSDNSRTILDGFNEADKVAVWSKKGKTMIVKKFIFPSEASILLRKSPVRLQSVYFEIIF